MRTARLFARALAILVGLFTLTILAPCALSAWALERNMTEQSRARGEAAAKSIAAAVVNTVLHGGPTRLQSEVDQYLEIADFAYIFITDPDGAVIAHTFVPQVPPELGDSRGENDRSAITTRLVRIPGVGDYLDSSAPILIGKIGYVHVGTAQSAMRASLWSKVAWQVGIMSLLFPPGALVAYRLMQTDEVRKERAALSRRGS